MIPPWNMEGLIPPIRPNSSGTSPERSPYRITATALVEQFGISSDRLDLLQGFLDYRQALYAAGLVQGFQWIDGSFMEDVENHEGRSPNDTDVVTYFYLPEGETQKSLDMAATELFDRECVKLKYKVDSYYVSLGYPLQEYRVRMITYWYSMWSHSRTNTWKGFAQINLDPDEDTNARFALLNKRQKL